MNFFIFFSKKLVKNLRENNISFFKILNFYLKFLCKISKFIQLQGGGLRPPNPLDWCCPFFISSPLPPPPSPRTQKSSYATGGGGTFLFGQGRVIDNKT